MGIEDSDNSILLYFAYCEKLTYVSLVRLKVGVSE